jgi:hypothetical protein
MSTEWVMPQTQQDSGGTSRWKSCLIDPEKKGDKKEKKLM